MPAPSIGIRPSRYTLGREQRVHIFGENLTEQFKICGSVEGVEVDWTHRNPQVTGSGRMLMFLGTPSLRTDKKLIDGTGTLVLTVTNSDGEEPESSTQPFVVNYEP